MYIAYGSYNNLQKLKMMLDSCGISSTMDSKSLTFNLAGTPPANKIFVIGLKTKLSNMIRFSQF
jgi:hypothetical protein